MARERRGTRQETETGSRLIVSHREKLDGSKTPLDIISKRRSSKTTLKGRAPTPYYSLIARDRNLSFKYDKLLISSSHHLDKKCLLSRVVLPQNLDAAAVPEIHDVQDKLVSPPSRFKFLVYARVN